jgi:hypothetical protein
VQPVLYDHREDASGLPALLDEAGVPLRAAQLPVGDYVISERVCVERKAGSDLAASIRDGRLFEQVERLLQTRPSPVLMSRTARAGSRAWPSAPAGTRARSACCPTVAAGRRRELQRRPSSC